MSNWFFDDDDDEEPDEVDVEEGKFIGYFECQDCGTPVGVASYDEDTQHLVWACPSGHISKVEMQL